MLNLQVLDKLEKAEMFYNAIKRVRGWVTAKDISRRVGCDRNTARDYLDYLHKHKLLDKKRLGNYKIYFPKDLNSKLNIRKYLEEQENLR